MNSDSRSLLEKSFLRYTLDAPPGVGAPDWKLRNGTAVELWDIGVLHFRPENHQQADSILVSVGVHGNETAPIEMIDALLTEIFSGHLKVAQNLLIVLANPAAIRLQQRYVDENMNRLFQPEQLNSEPVSARGNDEQRRARAIMQHSHRFFAEANNGKFHYDLHTAIRDSYFEKFAVSPNPHPAAETLPSFAFLEHCGIQAILVTEKKSATYSAFTAQHCGAIAFTLELGKVKPFGENDLSALAEISQCFRQAISGQPISQQASAERSADSPALFYIAHEVIKRTENFQLCFSDDAANFTEFKVGDLLATDTDYVYRVSAPGERILFPNSAVAIGQRALVVIRPLDQMSSN